MRRAFPLLPILIGAQAFAAPTDTSRIGLKFNEMNLGQARFEVPARKVVNLAVPFNASQLPFFCKQEYRFEQRVRVPFRFRIGSQENCDFLEGKRR